MRTSSLRALFLLPALVAMFFTALVPVGFAVYASVSRWLYARPDLPVKYVGLDNYTQLLDFGSPFAGALVRTLAFVVLAVGSECTLGLGLALILNRAFKGKALIVALLALPMMLTPVAIAYMWRYMYDAEAGIINFVLSDVGLGHPVWLQSVDPPWLSFAAILITDIWQWTPFVLLLALAGLASVPADLIDAARVDGASERQVTRHILLPLVAPTMLVAALLRGMGAFKEFDKIYILTGGGPGSTTELVSYRVFVDGLQQFNFGQTGVMAVLLGLIALVLARVFLSLSNRALKATRS